MSPFWEIAVDAFAAPVGQDATGHARALGARDVDEHQHRGGSRLGQDHRAARRRAREWVAALRSFRRAARARDLALPLGHGAAREIADLREWHERAVAALRIRHHELLLGPVAEDVRLAARRPRRTLRRGFRLDALAVPIEARAVRERDRADVARGGVGPVGRALNRDARAYREHLLCPARAAQRGRRTQLAPTLRDLAVRAGHVEVHPRMRIHEVELRDHAAELDVLVHREVAEAVMGAGRAGQEQSRSEQSNRAYSHSPLRRSAPIDEDKS